MPVASELTIRSAVPAAGTLEPSGAAAALPVANHPARIAAVAVIAANEIGAAQRGAGEKRRPEPIGRIEDPRSWDRGRLGTGPRCPNVHPTCGQLHPPRKRRTAGFQTGAGPGTN